ncbi:hypothetical protein CLV51_10817 [Chitinophaga niastensis]|uniref:Uncharacterized protein n=1 Tax=Chitinophaga niastensis TaxID=536980 RepID=A0A2P8HAS2_CHINA|nr:hypothetical protein [Chitinophaga niastensis]PSL43328.1 hypothetical protein CLV51_10817 [Chitinophaga niastensis]
MHVDNNKINVLNELHATFSNVAIYFRERVCEECNFSVPTFYRKMQDKDKLDAKGRLVRVFSNAEKEMIREIAKEVQEVLISSLNGLKSKS